MEQEAQTEERVSFRPNPGPQTDFLAATELQILYGGSAGSGKSFAMLADPVRYFGHPKFSGLLLRRTTEELRELIRESKTLYPQVFPKAKWSERDKTWTFPSGAQLWMSYLDRDDDVLRYQGQAFTWIGFDELTQWPTPHAWNYMSSRLRTTAPDLPLSQRASTNPGGPGHCLTHGEVLTPNKGWVNIRAIEAGDLIYSVDKEGNLFETTVDHTYKEWVEEDIVKVSARGFSMSITKDHKVAKVSGTKGAKNSLYTLVPFSDLPGQATILRSVSFKGVSPDYIEIKHSGGKKRKLSQPHSIKTDDYASLVGWYVSEGSRVHRDKAISIAQVKENGRKEICTLLDKIGYKYSINSSSIIIYCPSLYQHMSRYGDLCRNKKLTTEFKNLSAPNLKRFFDSAMMGDGHGSYYYTTSKDLSDDFQEVALKIGKIVYFSQRQRKDRVGPVYQISTKNTKSGGTEILTGHHKYDVATTTKRKSDVQKVPYKGYVYCVGIPETHTFIARQDGSVWVSGNTWVKSMFIDPSPWGKAFWATDIETKKVLSDPDPESPTYGQPLFKRRFIPAALQDNPYLTRDDNYRRQLLALPENQRRQLLYGDWDVAEGAAFTEWNREIHTCDPFPIPDHWTKFRACDYGYGSFSGVLWFAIEPKTETIYVYRELYVSKVLAVDLARQVLRMEREDGGVKYGVLDSSLWHKRGDTGPSLAEQMIATGCRWRPSDRSKGSRIAGKNEIHRRLQIDEFTEKPRLMFFNTCVNTVAQLPLIPLDKKNPEDVDTNYAHDHIYDALRYGLMSRPRSNVWDFDGFDSQDDMNVSDEVFGY